MRKLWIAVILVMVMVPALVWAKTFRYSVPTTLAAIPSYVADGKGFFKAEGVDVKLTIFSSGRQALDSVVSYSAELFSTSEVPPMHASLQGQPVQWVATICDHREVKITVNSTRIYFPEQLEGKKVATLPGTNSDFYMYKFFDYWGINAKKVKIVSMTPPNMVTAFVAGEVDAYAAWEPHNYYGYSKADFASATWPTDPNLYTGYQSIIMMKKTVNENQEAIQKMIRAWIKAAKFCNENPEEAQKIAAKYLRMDLADLKMMWGEFKFVVHMPEGLPGLLEAEWDYVIDLKKLDKKLPNWKNHIDTRAMNSVDPGLVAPIYK